MIQRRAGSSRREFASATAMVVPRHVLGGSGYRAPSDTLRIAGIGVGGMGRRYLQGCESERIVALCDVDHDFAAKVFRKYPQATTYKDWRKLMDREKEFDAVVIATPDHNHALITLAALKRGKAVYCAKPLTHTIHEARLVREAARKAGTATQTSVQSAASEEACSTAEVLMSGVIGGIREVHVWCDHPLYPAGQVRPSDSAGRAQGDGLGPVARAGRIPTVLSRLSSMDLAVVVGLWDGDRRRHDVARAACLLPAAEAGLRRRRFTAAEARCTAACSRWTRRGKRRCRR